MLHRIPGVVRRLGTAAGLNVGANDGDVVQVQSGGKLPALDGSLLTGIAAGSVLPGYLNGLTLSYGSATTFGIGPGSATDDSAAALMSIPSTLNKTTAAWVVGTGNGGLDTGTVAASTWYHVYLIQKSSDGTVDVLLSTSASAPTMPTGYDRKRRIGSLRTDGSGNLISFTANADYFLWGTRVTDVNALATAADSSGHLVTLSVPTGVNVRALFSARLDYSSGGGASLVFTSPSETDLATGGPVASLISVAGATNGAGHFDILTNTSAQIRERANGANSTYTIQTFGWIDKRGMD